MKRRAAIALRHGSATLLGAALLLGLWLISREDYLLFHALVELFTIVVSCGVFVIAWNARANLENGWLLSVGIASFFVALLDLLHTLAYKGMGALGDGSGNLATQLWLAGRYLQVVALLAAPAFLGRAPRVGAQLAAYAALTLLALLSIFVWPVFPPAFVEGSGLTPFKVASEYAIGSLLVVAGGLLYRKRAAFDRAVWRMLAMYLLLTIGSELAFTSYASVYGGMNLVGHFLRLLASWALYKAVIETGLLRPFSILLRDLQLSQQRLREYAEALETRNRVLAATEEQLRREAATLQSRNAELDAFAHTVAHDLKEPLAALLSASGVIRGVRNLPHDTLGAMLERMELTAGRMNGIVDELLLLAQVRQVEAPAGPVDMGRVVARVLDRLAEAVHARDARIQLPERWPSALGYAPWLEEVWANYLSNALKYGCRPGEPPRLEVGADALPAGPIRFWLRDHGPGVAPEARATLFVAFGEASPHRPDSHGLGLSIVLQIVKKLGGEVGCASEEGQGSEFWFTLPAAADVEGVELPAAATTR